MANSNKKIVIEWSDLATPRESATETDGHLNPSNGQSEELPDGRMRRHTAKIVILLLLVFVATIVAGIALYSTFRRPDWVERIASTADKSVVWIQTKDGIGAGFVIASRDNRRLILTNKHVLTVTKGWFLFSSEEQTDRCAVVLRSKTELIGCLVGLPKDDSMDLALVMVETDELRPLRIRPFEKVEIGEPVVAVGHPDGLDFTITDGRISAKRMGLWLQTSAPINHGNSGGPLIDQGGCVVGVNTWKPDDTESIGFAIRADIATEINAWKCNPEAAELLGQIAH